MTSKVAFSLLSRFGHVQRLVCLRQSFVHRRHGRKKAPARQTAGASWHSRVETSVRPFPLCIEGAERLLVALILSWDLSVHAKNLFVEASRLGVHS
jgi:hypothetical protein